MKQLLQKEQEKFFYELTRRVRFNYKFKDMVIGLFSCFRCCIKKNKHLKRRELFNKASAQLMQEFDAITLLKTIKQMEVLTGVFLNKHQSRMLEMQRKNVIEIEPGAVDES